MRPSQSAGLGQGISVYKSRLVIKVATELLFVTITTKQVPLNPDRNPFTSYSGPPSIVAVMKHIGLNIDSSSTRILPLRSQ